MGAQVARWVRKLRLPIAGEKSSGHETIVVVVAARHVSTRASRSRGEGRMAVGIASWLSLVRSTSHAGT